MTGFVALEEAPSSTASRWPRPWAAARPSSPRHDRLQEPRHDPSYAEQILCFTRRWSATTASGARSESPRPHVRAVLMREAAGPAWTDWLHERGCGRALRARHALARPAPAGARACARSRVAGSTTSTRRSPGAGAAPMEGGPSSPQSLRSRRTSIAMSVVRHRCRRLRLQALDPAPLASAGARVTSTDDVDADTLAATTASSSRTARAIGAPADGEETVAPPSAGPVLGICLAPAARPRDGATRSSSVRPPGLEHPVLERARAVLVTSQNTASPCARPGATRRATSRSNEARSRPRPAGGARRSLQFHPRAGRARTTPGVSSRPGSRRCGMPRGRPPLDLPDRLGPIVIGQACEFDTRAARPRGVRARFRTSRQLEPGTI